MRSLNTLNNDIKMRIEILDEEIDAEIDVLHRMKNQLQVLKEDYEAFTYINKINQNYETEE